MLQLHISPLSEEARRRERLEKIKAYCVAPVELEEEQDVDRVVGGDELKWHSKWQWVAKKLLSESGPRHCH